VSRYCDLVPVALAHLPTDSSTRRRLRVRAPAWDVFSPEKRGEFIRCVGHVLEDPSWTGQAGTKNQSKTTFLADLNTDVETWANGVRTLDQAFRRVTDKVDPERIARATLVCSQLQLELSRFTHAPLEVVAALIALVTEETNATV